MVSDTVLLQGSWCALEQAGRILCASTAAFDSGDSATGLALAMLAREELGRSFLLRDLAAEVLSGKSFSADEVNTRCEDHVRKQKAAVLSTTLRVVPPGGLAEALRTQSVAARGTPAWADARALIRTASCAKQKRDPNDRHLTRMRALYVDLNPDGLTWSRPSDIDRTTAREEIEDAVGDYALALDALRDEVISADFPEMAAARQSMNPAPKLAEPRWPAVEGTG